MTPSSDTCPCESGKTFKDCCEPFILGTQFPSTAEQLMRSRYSAYVTANRDYLLQTWHPSTRPTNLEIQPEVKWLGLKIKATQAGQENDTTGTVEFVARSKVAGKGYRLHEKSEFIRAINFWYYLKGKVK